MPRTRNPFRRGGLSLSQGYNDPAMGAAAQGIGALLLAGETPYEREDRAAKARLNTAQTSYNEAGARKRTAEAAGLERSNALMSDDELFNSALSAEGLDHRLPNEDIQSAFAADPGLKARVTRRFGALRQSNQIPGRTNSHQLEQGLTEQGDRSLGEMVLGGRVTPQAAGAAIGAREGKPQYAIQGDTKLGLYDGSTQTTELGGAKIKERESQSRQNDAAAGNQRAQAGEHSARTGQINEEVRTGIKAGAPVIAEGPDGISRYISPREAVGGAVGARPKAPGATKTHAVPFNQADEIDSEINAQLGVRLEKASGKAADGSALPLTPSDMTRVRTRAAQLFQTSGDGPGAVRQALQEMGALEDVPNPGRLWGQNAPTQRRAKQSVGSMVAPAGGAAAPASASIPPEAASRLKEGVVTRFGNGQAWTMQGGKPVQVE